MVTFDQKVLMSFQKKLTSSFWEEWSALAFTITSNYLLEMQHSGSKVALQSKAEQIWEKNIMSISSITDPKLCNAVLQFLCWLRGLDLWFSVFALFSVFWDCQSKLWSAHSPKRWLCLCEITHVFWRVQQLCVTKQR